MCHKKSIAIISVLFFMTLSLSSGIKAVEGSTQIGDILSSVFGSKETEEFHKVFALSAGGTFGLKNVNGSVTIVTWKEDKVDIKAIKSTKHGRERLKLVKIEVESTPNSVYVDTIYAKRKNVRVSVEYEIRVPEGVNLENIKTVNGSVRISGPCLDVKASSTNGSVKLTGGTGNISLSTTNGEIKAADVKGKLDAGTTNGGIELELSAFENDIEAKTVNGGITLSLGSPKKINAELRVRTVNGRIHVDIPITLKSLSKSRRSLEAQIGEGGPLISLRAVNGSIRIED